MPRIAIIEFFTTDKKTILFVIRPEYNEPVLEDLNISNSHIMNCKEKLLGNPEKGMLGAFERIDPNNPQRLNIDFFYDLSERILDKFIKHVEGYDILYFIPHGWLHYLPLHALKFGDGSYLIEKYAVIYAPSASVIKYCQAKNSSRKDKKTAPPTKRCLSFGVGMANDHDSLINSFHTEAEYVWGTAFNERGTCKTGLKASKQYFMENCKENEVIHIACHGYFNELQPLKSGLVLSDGTRLAHYTHNTLKYQDDSTNFFLTVEDIFNLKLEADLIVLSACVTGMNTNRPGDELIGLTRAFIYAGTPSVIASLWHSYSDSTLELIRNFYKYWNNSTEPMSKAKALQKAQIELIHNGQHRAWRHPYHWALFILIGDWL